MNKIILYGSTVLTIWISSVFSFCVGFLIGEIISKLAFGYTIFSL